ncbi:ricin-type beta-trefoil lectin domain protein [Streptomyces sp. NBC_01198]|uniref:ricin-type beta-trefoil lectin domain protein n=1 Tax=Streptomyces sp. NBC_01198 TaxID=2903769 RepID=UPI002E151D60|nr:ricin-type beta-trefoil lectin domain protein [Streptomyces sp. NBC_01198]
MSRPLSALLVALVTAALGAAAGLTTAAAAPAASTTALSVMPLGDSITWGVGSSTGNGYRGPLHNELVADGHPTDFVGTLRNGTMSDPDNEGHSGYRIDQIAALADASLARYRPNVVTLEIGTNDLNGNYQVSTATARLKSLVDQITADVPDATVLLASLIVSTSSGEEQHRAAYNQAIPGIVQSEQAAGKHVGYVDMSALTSADLSDSLHPNDGGYQKMADAFHRGVQAADSAGWLHNPASAGAPVVSGITGKCLDVNGGSSADGTPVQIWSCDNAPAQAWSAYPDGTLRAVGKCLDATGRGTANGTKVEIWTCNGGANQVWQTYNGGYRNPVSGRCLDDPASSTTNGTQLQLWDCNGNANQKWTLTTG